MQYIGGVMQEMEAIVEDASRVPMRRGRVVVDRSDLLVMLDELRDSLPRELEEAEEIRRECQSIIESGREEARRIIEQARQEAEARALESEEYRRAQRYAGETVDRAEQYAREVVGGAEAYRDQVLGQLEGWFEESMDSIMESRRELSGWSAAREQQQTTQHWVVYEEDGSQRHWRAS